MTLKNLCVGNNEESPYFGAGAGEMIFKLLGRKEEDLGKRTLQLEIKDGTQVYNFDSWKNDLNKLAEELVNGGVTPREIEDLISHVE